MVVSGFLIQLEDLVATKDDSNEQFIIALITACIVKAWTMLVALIVRHPRSATRYKKLRTRIKIFTEGEQRKLYSIKFWFGILLGFATIGTFIVNFKCTPMCSPLCLP